MTTANMTGDLWALAAAMLLAVVQLTLSSVLTLRQLGGIWVAGSRDEPRGYRRQRPICAGAS